MNYVVELNSNDGAEAAFLNCSNKESFIDFMKKCKILFPKVEFIKIKINNDDEGINREDKEDS